MAKEKSKDNKLKRLYRQLHRFSDQKFSKTVLTKDFEEKEVITSYSRIEQRIMTLENS